MSKTARRASWAVPLLLVGAWMVAAVVGWPSRRAIPAAGTFVETAIAELSSWALWADTFATLARTLGGVAIAVPVGAALGVAIGRRPHVFRAIEPSLDFVRAVPPILTLPLFLLALGYGEASRIACIATSATGLVALHVGSGLARAPTERAEAVALAGLHPLDELLVLHLFEAVPALVTGARVAVTASLVVAVVSEMLVGAEHGLGARALTALLAYRADVLWLVIAMTGAIGLSLSALLAAFERRFCKW